MNAAKHTHLFVITVEHSCWLKELRTRRCFRVMCKNRFKLLLCVGFIEETEDGSIFSLIKVQNRVMCKNRFEILLCWFYRRNWGWEHFFIDKSPEQGHVQKRLRNSSLCWFYRRNWGWEHFSLIKDQNRVMCKNGFEILLCVVFIEETEDGSIFSLIKVQNFRLLFELKWRRQVVVRQIFIVAA